MSTRLFSNGFNVICQPSIHISSQPLKRLGRISTSKDILKVVACTFSGYHAVKFQFCGLFNSGGPFHYCKVIPSDIQYAIFKLFAEMFSAEANELGLSTRSFDLESFIAFLSAWETPGPAAHVDVQW